MQSTCGASAAGCGAAGTALRSYAYTLGPSGNRLSVAELNGRTVNYGYDDLYRLTSETVASDPGGRNGQVTYSYDSVGNRTQLSSTLAAVPSTGLLNYDANDRTATDSYDANGNLTFNGQQNVYDFENRLVQRGGVKIVYDGDGNRVQETVAGVVTRYLTGEVNPTGYVQVMAELSGTNQILRGYEWGLQLAAVRDFTVNSGGIFHYYGLDGHGSVRFLTSSTGAVTDTYDYDAFGNLISSTGTTFNNYMFAGEQFDPALGIYYNRARYYDQRQGRFWTMDTFEGDPESPASLHRYLYAGANPVNRVDPSGYLIEQETAARGIGETIDAEVTQLYRQIGAQIARKLVAAGVVLGGGYIGFLISTVTPDPVPSTATQNPQSSPTQTGEDEPGGDAIWLYRTGNSTRVDPPRILGFNRTAQQSYDMAPDTSNKLFGPFPWPDGASTFRSPARLSGHIWKVQKGAIYSELGLGVIADGVDAVPPGPRGAGHHTIFPIVPMSPEDFTNAFYALPWLPAGKK